MEKTKIITYDFDEWKKIYPTLKNMAEETQKKLRQRHVNFIRTRVMMIGLVNFLKKLWAEHEDGNAPEEYKRPGVYHIWFDDKNLLNYGRREGNPPSMQERPKWMKYLDIECDYNQLSKEVWRECAPDGEFAEMVREFQGKSKKQKSNLFSGRQLIVPAYEVTE